MRLKNFSKLIQSSVPGFGKLTNKGDLDDLADSKLNKATNAITTAEQRVVKLKNKPRGGYLAYRPESKVHDTILDWAMVITNAITELIRAATVDTGGDRAAGPWVVVANRPPQKQPLDRGPDLGS